MAPALTKSIKDGHGIHLSSPLASNNVDSDGGAVLNIELEPEMKMVEDCFSHKMWLNLSSLPLLDSCLSKSPLDFPDNPVIPPFMQAPVGQCKTVLLPIPGSLLSLLSLGRSLKDSYQLATAHPGVPDMFFIPLPEHNSRDACLQQGHSGAPGRWPDGGDMTLSPPPPPPPPPPFSCGEIQPQYHAVLLTSPTALTQGEADHLPAPAQPWGVRMASDQPASEAALEQVVREQTQWQLTRQAGLLSRAGRLQRRLQCLLGEHASLHCSQQLEGLKKRPPTRGTCSDTPEPPPSPVGSNSCFSPLESSRPLSPATELREFGRSSQAVLRGLQEALDSEATASSSSDEEPEEDKCRRGTRPLPCSSVGAPGSGVRRWLEDRAEVGSRWSWLLLRLAELEGRIRQLGDLHKHICSTKGSVVLAESQPLTDRQIQQTLLRETAGLSYAAGAGGGELLSDADMEPSSPTCLLRNIERQSAQLSQIVNSLMPPLNLSPFSSPLSKQPQAWRGVSKTAFSSDQGGHEIFSLDGTKRRKMGSRRRQQLLQAEASCVCARTRPLVTYHKPRLFTLHSTVTDSPQNLESTTTLSSSSSSTSSSCLTCSSHDPLTLCCNPTCNSTSSLARSRLHPVLSLSSDTPLSHHMQRALAREEWSQSPLVVDAEPSSPVHYNRLYHSSTPLHNSHNYKHRVRHRRGGIRGVSPVRRAGSAQTPHTRAYQGTRKRRHAYRVIDEEDFPYQLFDHEESSEESLEEANTPNASHTRRTASQGSVRKRQGDSVYNIDNIIMPVSLAATSKVEKLQYKDILTPSWRMIDLQSLKEREGEEEEEAEEVGKKKEEEEREEVEVLTDDVFSKRHLASEQREKLRWSSWGKSPQYRRPTRCGGRSSGGGEVGGAWGEESPVDWSSSQLDTDEQPSREDWLPEAPWELRVFPLDEDEEEALWSDVEEQDSPQWSEGQRTTATSITTSFTANNSNSHLSSGPSSGASPPSAGQRRNNAPKGC